jgi:hypothetical protein
VKSDKKKHKVMILEQQHTYDEKGEISPQVEGFVSKEIVIKRLKNVFQN